MARKQNPRRVALEKLRDIKALAERTRYRWDVRSTVSERFTETRNGREFLNSRQRPRTAEEYPENDVAAWAELNAEAARLKVMADELMGLSYREWKRLRAAEVDAVREG